jgi:hypothetical protein
MPRLGLHLRAAACLLLAGSLIVVGVGPTAARDKPSNTSTLHMTKLATGAEDFQGQTDSGGQFSKTQIERFRCTSSGNPAATVDMSCNTSEYGQNWAPDNEIAIAVNPANPNHLVAGSNDYFYRFNNSTGARQAIVLTGFFTSFDGGASWIDGQIPVRSGNGAGDPSPAFVSDPRSPSINQTVVLMAQLENTGGQGGPWVSQGDVSVSYSLNGGINWSEPVTVMKGTGTGIGPANRATFFDKEWLTCDNWPSSPWRGRCYVTATRFLNALQGSYAESPIVLSYSDDGGQTWSAPVEISGSHPSCTFQSTGGGTECDENQFSYPEVAPDGDLYVHFINFQNEAAWEVPFDFDGQIMVVKSTNGGQTFGSPVQVVQIEDGLSDMPFSVIVRQTIWGHQIRWNAAGNITADPTNANHITIVFADRGTPNANALSDPDCFFGLPGPPPTYDPCNAGPGADTNVYRIDTFDGGMTWGPRTLVDAAGGRHQWFPWADYKPDGTLAIAWDEDVDPSGTMYPPAPANDEFLHVLLIGGAKQALTPTTGTVPHEQVDISVTHWAGQYVPMSRWPRVCGPAGYSDPPVANATGKDCNVFHGDYTGLATDSLGRVHVVWTGLNRLATSPQTDFYTGQPHDGYVQDAMYARR